MTASRSALGRERSRTPGFAYAAEGAPRSVAAVPAGVIDPAPVVRYAYYAFLATIPYETLDIGLGTRSMSIAKLAGWVFLLATLAQPSACWRKPPSVLWLFGSYLTVAGVLGVLGDPRHATDVAIRVQQQVQMLALLWCSANLLQSEKVVRGALGALAASAGMLAILQLTGVTAVADRWGDVERITVLGEDPNNAAFVMSTGLLCAIALAIGRRSRGTPRPLLRALSLFFMPPVLLVAIMNTGSRGNLVGLFIGLIVLTVAGAGTRTRWMRVPLVVLLLGAAVFAAVRTETMRVRVERAIEDRKAAGREQIHPLAIDMVLERPVAGWGPVENVYELGRRIGTRRKDTHNVYLWVLTETGLLGGVPFLLGMALCVRAAFRARAGREGVAPLALIATLLVVELGTTDHNRKLFWFLLAYAWASGSKVVLEEGRREPGSEPDEDSVLGEGSPRAAAAS